MNSILIADDHVLFREGMQFIIGHWEDFEVCGEASNGAQAIELAHELLPDILLMDVHMPVMDGIEATRRLSRELPSVRIVMLTISEEEEDLFNAIKCGAQGYVLKDTPSKRLHDELRRMLQGESPLSGLMATKVLDEFNRFGGSSQKPYEYQEPLTKREQQVLELLVEGLSNSQIADKICLSENTVKKHLRNVLDKLHLNNRVEAAVYAVREGLVVRK
jgi:two-component system nitrate/nitrite response regulator NarL